MHNINVLVVDDDVIDRKQVRRLLGKTVIGAQIREADDRDTALALSDPTPDVAIIDYRLPGWSGLEVMTELRERHPHLTCLIMTGDGDEEVAKTAIKLGAFDYIQKSKLTEKSLLRMIEHGLERSRMQFRLEDQRRELEIFADVLIHDLKAPIRAVGFLTKQIGTDMAANDEPSVQTGLGLLKRSADQMAALVDSLARHVQLNRDVIFEEVHLKQLFDAALTAIERDITESGAHITLDFSDRAITCCAPQISQLLQNLIANSMKYRSETPPRIEVSVTEEPMGNLLICLSDNGVGIPDGYHERIFEPFKRAPSHHGTTGTGLGLATCRKVIERHHGRIWCESREGLGSTFFVSMPQDGRAPGDMTH